jgi:hypothetical protein
MGSEYCVEHLAPTEVVESDYSWVTALGVEHYCQSASKWEVQGYCDWHPPAKSKYEEAHQWDWILHTGFRHIKYMPTVIDWREPKSGIHPLDDKILLDKAS